MSEWNVKRREPTSGSCRSMVVFLHGYGANGADLIGLGDVLAPHLPDTLFLSPDAPERCIGAPMGLQWFPIPWIDGSSEADAEASLLRAAADLQRFLYDTLDAEDLLPEQLALVGFSQGTMMALQVAPRMEEAVAGVVGFSGRLLRPDLLEQEATARFPTLLVHGDEDEVVPPSCLPEAVSALQGAGFADVYAHVMKGCGHGIAPDGLEVALAFLRDELGF